MRVVQLMVPLVNKPSITKLFAGNFQGTFFDWCISTAHLEWYRLHTNCKQDFKIYFKSSNAWVGVPPKELLLAWRLLGKSYTTSLYISQNMQAEKGLRCFHWQFVFSKSISWIGSLRTLLFTVHYKTLHCTELSLDGKWSGKVGYMARNIFKPKLGNHAETADLAKKS